MCNKEPMLMSMQMCGASIVLPTAFAQEMKKGQRWGKTKSVRENITLETKREMVQRLNHERAYQSNTCSASIDLVCLFSFANMILNNHFYLF